MNGLAGSVRPNPRWTGYRCVLCGRAHGPEWTRFVCEVCGPEGILDVTYDYAAIAADLADAPRRADHPFPEPWSGSGLWRFAPLLPLVPDAPHPAWALGGTPLHAPAALRSETGLPRLLLKDDTGLPSASLKDRAAAVVIADAVRLGRTHVACASTGNAAASLAVLGARAGLRRTIFVPADAPRPKLAQLLLHGAQVIRVSGSYDQAFELSLRAIEERGWYSRNCAHNPLLLEGKKTAALEIARDLGWRAPDAVFVGTGDGCIVSSVGKAFAELREVGLCDRLPRVYGVQASGAAPLAEAWAAAARDGGTAAAGPAATPDLAGSDPAAPAPGTGPRPGTSPGAAPAPSPAPAPLDGREILARIRPVVPRTVADSISVGVPRNRIKAWQQVAATGGGFLAVTDEQILLAVRMLARWAGVFAEPSGAAGMAGCLEARRLGLIGADELVVVLITGHGLKDPTAALGLIEMPEPVPPDLAVAELPAETD